jgi:hypothetical protein
MLVRENGVEDIGDSLPLHHAVQSRLRERSPAVVRSKVTAGDP